jgi:hypothetical protein
LEIQRAAGCLGNTELFPEQSEQQGEDNADKNRGSNGEVKSEFSLFDQDITGQLSDPGNLIPNQEENTDKDYENPQKNKHLPQRTHSKHLHYPLNFKWEAPRPQAGASRK